MADASALKALQVKVRILSRALNFLQPKPKLSICELKTVKTKKFVMDYIQQHSNVEINLLITDLKVQLLNLASCQKQTNVIRFEFIIKDFMQQKSNALPSG